MLIASTDILGCHSSIMRKFIMWVFFIFCLMVRNQVAAQSTTDSKSTPTSTPQNNVTSTPTPTSSLQNNVTSTPTPQNNASRVTTPIGHFNAIRKRRL